MHRRSAVFDQLDAEWRYLNSTTLYQRECDCWIVRYRAFAGSTDCADIVATLLDPGCGYEHKDSMLRALVVQASREGDANPVAARVAMQAMLPGVRSRARGFHHCDHDDAAAAMLAGMVEAIATYPYERRPRRVAANLLWLAFDRALRTTRAKNVEIPAGLDLTEPAPVASSSVELLDVVQSAVLARVLRPDEATLVVRRRLTDMPRAEIAAEAGVSENVIYRRQYHAERRLRDAGVDLLAAG